MVGNIDRAAFQFPNSTFAQEANGFEDFAEPGTSKRARRRRGWLP
jgi:hypothetical protein